MKPLNALIGLLFFFLFLTSHVKGQQYFLYETNTLAESSLNPESEVFYGSKCKRFAFNFFVPGIHTSAIVLGPAGKFIYDSYIISKINSGAFKADPGKTDYVLVDTRLNIFSMKFMLNESKRSELLIDYQLRGFGKGDFINGLFGLSVASKNINQGDASSIRQFDNYLNTNSYYMVFSQLSAGLRKNFDEDLSGGIMFSFLSGISASNLYISNSSLYYPNNTNGPGGQQLQINSNGYFLTSLPKGNDNSSSQVNSSSQFNSTSQFNSLSNYLPNFKNPGLNLSAGLRYRVDDVSAISLNIKDLGFISWRNALEYDLKPSTTIKVDSFSISSEAKRHFNTFISDGVSRHWIQAIPVKMEAAYSDRFFSFLHSSLIISKPLLSSDIYFTAINDFNYKNAHLILNTGYDSRQASDIGLHFLYRSAGTEFFIGSERLIGLSRLRGQLAQYGQANKRISGDINIGFALKFGSCFYIQTATDMHLDGKRPGFFKRMFQ